MIKLKLREPKTKGWKKWRADGKKLAAEHLDALGNGEPTEINEKLYKRTKQTFIDLSHGYCAYCGEVVDSNQPGDIEHFRPKGGVQNIDFKNVEVDYGNGPEKHRGYPWLAYDCTNLLLSCAKCNRKTKVQEKRYFGKDQRFPVKGKQACLPDQLANEEPLLIHPGQVDPAKHIEFNPKTGLLNGLTDEGTCTITVLGLNMRELPAKRRDVYLDVTSVVREYLNIYPFAGGGGEADDLVEQLQHKIAEIKKGAHRFPMVARLAVTAVSTKIAEAQANLD